MSCSRVDELLHEHQLIRYLTDMTTSMLMSLYKSYYQYCSSIAINILKATCWPQWDFETAPLHRDHFLARFRDILAFFCKKSHQNSRSEKKNRTLIFSHFAPLRSYFAHAVHFETIGLFCLTGFWFIVAPKFITHTTAGNHSLICIIGKLYRKKIIVGLWFK